MRVLARLLRAYPLFLAGVVIVSSLAMIALLAPILAPPTSSDPFRVPYDGPPKGDEAYYYVEPTFPSSKHLFGTLLGYDVFYGCVWGTRIAFYVSISAVLLCLAIGITIGSISGYFEGIVDEVLMRFTDAFFALPGIIYVLLIMGALPLHWDLHLGLLNFTVSLSSFEKIILALAIVGWPPYARLIRGEIKKVKQQDFVEAAKAGGCSKWRVIIRHVLPNSINPMLSFAFLNVGGILIVATTLSYLGFGPGIGYAEWGSIIAGAATYLVFITGNAAQFVLLLLIPGAFLSAFALGWNFLGDTIIYALDPTLSRRLIIWESQGSSLKD